MGEDGGRTSMISTRRMALLTSSTSLALESNNVTLDPDLKDAAGRPAGSAFQSSARIADDSTP